MVKAEQGKRKVKSWSEIILFLHFNRNAIMAE